MTALTKDNLDKLIESRIEDFKKVHNAISSYNSERQTMGDYNGRQILELLQNADDAEAENIEFRLDTQKKELVFYNDGTPFVLEGVESIMIPNYSSKVSSSYIGNKGLGFRSILNWADSVTIYSAGLKIDFSLNVLKHYLSSKLTDLNSKLPDIRWTRNLSNECIPLPILGLPSVCEESYAGCDANRGCALVIHYNEDKEKDIIKQIKAVDERTLLFLQHIKEAIVPDFSDVNTNRCIQKTDDWDIYPNEEEELDEQYQDKSRSEKKKYSIKIAIPKKGLLDESSCLYNYLPTQEQVRLPFILHVTVELDASRNHLQNSKEVNGFILEKAAELIRDIAQKKLDDTQNHSDWTAYRMMTPTVSENEYGSLKPLYEKLDELRKDMAIYPTVDNRYVTENEYFYYDDEISRFWNDFNVKEGCILKVLKPREKDFWIRMSPFRDLSETIKAVSTQLKGDDKSRVRLIRHIYDFKNVYLDDFFVKKQTKIPVLIDGGCNVIESEAYFQDSGDSALTGGLPSWVVFTVVHDGLVSELKDEFKKEIENIQQEKKLEDQLPISDVRCLVRLLSDFVDVGYFDKTYIAKEVVRQANDLLDKDAPEKPKLIGEMLDYLYELRSDAKLERVRLLDANGDVCKAEELLLPREIDKEIFGEGARYVLDLAGWQDRNSLKGVLENLFIEFMEKLGVNRMLEEIEFGRAYQNGYNAYLGSRKVYRNNNGEKGRRQLDLEKGMGMRGGNPPKKIPAVRKFIMERLEQIDLRRVLLFIASYPRVFEKLNEKLNLSFHYNKDWKDDTTPYNYVRCQLSSLPSVKWNVFGTNLILDDAVDVEKLGSGAKRTIADAAELIRTDFEYETVKEIQGFLKEYPKKFPDGKNVRKLYKLIIDSWGEHKTGLEEVPLYASDANGKKEYQPSTKVFYTSNTCLPKRVIENLGLFRLDYPTRQAANNITNIFGLFKVDELNFKIEDFQDSDSSKEFDVYFRKLKPYFLLYAIQNASKDTSKATIAGYIKKSSIHLVSKCEYSIKGEKHEALDAGEFINVKDDYYLKVPEGFSIADMKSSPTYCDAIMEILGMAFRLETKNEDFLHVFQGFDFMKRYIDDRRKDEIDECYRLLGLSPEEKVFWEKYNELKKLELGDLDAISESSGFYSKLGFEEQEVKKVDFSNWSNKESIDFLKKVLDNLGSADQKEELLRLVDLSAWHRTCFETIKIKYWKAFVHKLWTILNEQCKDMRPKYFSMQDDYSKLELKDNGWKHELKDDADYLAYLNRSVKDLFEKEKLENIEVGLETEFSEEHGNLYLKLIKTTQDEKDMDEKRWWLYFEGNEERIRGYKDELKKNEETDLPSADDDNDDVEGEIITTGVASAEFSGASRKRQQKITGTHKTETERGKVKAGEEAEKKVDCYLRQLENNEGGRFKYGQWVSKTDDCAGYDFTYFVDGQLRYLEAKVNSNNSFTLSANEYAVAQQNKDIYDVAIVEGKKVTIIQSFFTGNPLVNPKDYKVSFRLQSK